MYRRKMFQLSLNSSVAHSASAGHNSSP